ncbi:MAG: hypothetical protein L0228_04330 [Planctomycetes bacterium]|nr:hypothetical protein [Planctomycetota bacterium]
MTHPLGKCALICVLAVIPLGCEPRPVVVNPDADDDTTIIEERDVEVDRVEPNLPPPESGTSVEVDVGGGQGVDVDVSRDAENPNP